MVTDCLSDNQCSNGQLVTGALRRTVVLPSKLVRVMSLLANGVGTDECLLSKGFGLK
jgi:hypothetical protein